MLDGELARDSRTVHVNGNPVIGVDPSTFELLHGAYARDGWHVFYFDQSMAEADLTSFRPLDGPYASDSARVYWMGKTIGGADPDPQMFLPDKVVTNCSETSISFAE